MATIITTSVTGVTLSGGGTAQVGASFRITAVVDNNYKFNCWSVKVGNTIKYIYTGDTNETPFRDEGFDVSFSATKNASNTTTYYLIMNSISDLTYTIGADISYTGDSGTSSDSYTISAGNNPAGGSLSINTISGTAATATAALASGYDFEYWTVNSDIIYNNTSGSKSTYDYNATSSGNDYSLALTNISTDLTVNATSAASSSSSEVVIDESKYAYLYEDADANQLIYPRTKAGAITLEDDTNLEQLLAQLRTLL